MECLVWLDAQEPGSVVYVSLGSHAVLSPAQVTELAWGLAATGRPFLWAVRDDLVSGLQPAAVLPAEFFETGDYAGAQRCLITTWCAQEAVLRHRAVGCFLTHAGWNSACEGVAAGVPVVCWPELADQYTNARLACHVWGVGARLALDGAGGELRREEVAARVSEVMKKKEIAERAAEWKAMAAEAASPGGTSYQTFLTMVEAITVNAAATVPVPAGEDHLAAGNKD